MWFALASLMQQGSVYIHMIVLKIYKHEHILKTYEHEQVHYNLFMQKRLSIFKRSLNQDNSVGLRDFKEPPNLKNSRKFLC